jgi:aminoglycoside 6'-N-acetyltransferase I
MDMEISVREMVPADRAAWTDMRAALWPDEDREILAEEVDRMLSGADTWGFIAETGARQPAGFAEISVRKYANGCETQPVPFLEGIWAAPKFRRQGIGATLIRHIEAFLIARGYRELGSDALLDNTISHQSHRGWGFSETERVVYFRKSLVR